MKLSRKEEKRNRVISVGVALLVFGGLLFFFILVTFNRQGAKANEDTKAVELNMQLQGNEMPAQPVSIKASNNNAANSSANKSSNEKLPSDVESTIIKYKARPVNTNESEVGPRSEITPSASVTLSQEMPGESNISSLHMAFDLAQRKIIQLPKISSDTKEEGKVVVEIVVDSEGNVIEANPNGRGTTTCSAVLKIKARQTAMTAKFSPDEKIAEQKGTITIIFSFN